MSRSSLRADRLPSWSSACRTRRGGDRERVRAAFAALGLALPPKRVIVNLAPADLPKEGSHYDLANVLSMLAKLGVLPEDQLSRYAANGELSQDGRLVETAGELPAAMAAEAQAEYAASTWPKP